MMVAWLLAKRPLRINYQPPYDKPPNLQAIIDRRNNIIFVTHGAMSRGLRDNWVRLALIHQAIKHRKNASITRRNMSKFMSRLLDMRWVEKNGKEIWEDTSGGLWK